MKAGSNKPSNIFSSFSTKELNKSRTQKGAPAVCLHVKPISQTTANSFIVPTVVPRETSDGKEASRSRRESIISAKAEVGVPDKSSHISRPSNSKLDVNTPPLVAESYSVSNVTGSLESTRDIKFNSRLVADGNSKESCREKPTVKIVTENSGKPMSLIPSNQEKGKFPYFRYILACNFEPKLLKQVEFSFSFFIIIISIHTLIPVGPF